MLTRIKLLPALLLLAPAISLATPPPADTHSPIVIVFQDGHRQTLDMSDLARIDFKPPVTVVFKDGHQQTISSTDIARIEFEPAASLPGRNHFVGKWKVGEGNGSNFYITLDANGEARKSIGPSHCTWTVVDGEARITWDDRWHDAIRKVGSSYEKRAYEPGKSFDETPSNVTAATNTQPQPI
ncbi:MAG: hypothetical protein WAL56_16715 [Candidatus Sulfotelmatobacter sp.]